MENLNESEINEMFSFVFGWVNVPEKRQRSLLSEFLRDQGLALNDILFELENF